MDVRGLQVSVHVWVAVRVRMSLTVPFTTTLTLTTIPPPPDSHLGCPSPPLHRRHRGHRMSLGCSIVPSIINMRCLAKHRIHGVTRRALGGEGLGG